MSLLSNNITHMHALNFFFDSQHKLIHKLQQTFCPFTRLISIHRKSHFMSKEPLYVERVISCRKNHFMSEKQFQDAGSPIIHVFFLRFRPPLESYFENSACNFSFRVISLFNRNGREGDRENEAERHFRHLVKRRMSRSDTFLARH